MDLNTFVEEFKVAMSEMVPGEISGAEVDDGVLRKGTIQILGTEIALVAMKSKLREVLIIRKVAQTDPDAPKQKVNPKYQQSMERMIHTENAWELVENASEQLMETIQRLILPATQEEQARRRQFRQELVARQMSDLHEFTPEDQKLITNLLSRPENRGYGRTHWGNYAVEALVFFGPNRLINMAEKTFLALEDLCLGKGSVFGGFHREKNRTSGQIEEGIPPNAMWIASRTRASGLGKMVTELDTAFKAQNYKPGIAAYGIEIVYKVLRAIKDRDAAAALGVEKPVDTSKDLVIKLMPKVEKVEGIPANTETSDGPVSEPIIVAPAQPVLTLEEKTALYEASVAPQTTAEPAQVIDAVPAP